MIVSLRQASSGMARAEPIIIFSGLLPKASAPSSTPPKMAFMMVGLIFTKVSSWKIRVRVPKKRAAPPEMAGMGAIRRSSARPISRETAEPPTSHQVAATRSRPVKAKKPTRKAISPP